MITENNIIAILLILPIIASICSFLTGKQRILRELIVILSSIGFSYVVYLLILLPKDKSFYLELIAFSRTLFIGFTTEPVGIIFLMIVAILWPLANLYSCGYLFLANDHNRGSFFGFLSLSIFCTIGIALSANLFTLFIFYELLTLVTYPLVVYLGSEKAREAGQKYIYYLLGASTFLLMPAIIILHDYSSNLIFNNGQELPNFPSNLSIGLVLTLLLYGTAKIALFPLHGWLPSSMVAPTPVSALLHSVTIVKGGVFTLLKIIVYVLGVDTVRKVVATTDSNWFTYLAAIGVIYASVKASKQDGFKALLAYSTVAQVANCLLALSISTQGAIIACILHILGHAFAKITLFFVAGAIYVLYGKSNISDCKLLGKENFLLCISFTIAALSLIGIPPFLGFWSKYYIILAAWEVKNWPAIVALLISTLLTVSYMIPIIYKFFWHDQRSSFQLKISSLRDRIYIYIPIIVTTIICFVGIILIPYIVELIENNIKS